MNPSADDRWGRRFLPAIILRGIFWLCLLSPVTGFCQEKTDGAPQGPSGIHITAQRLVFRQNDRYAEFSGNVRAAQGDTVIRSDALKVFYKEGADLPSGGGNNEAFIERIIAFGNVTITTGNQTATSEQAVYTPGDGMLVLTGGQVRVESNGNFVTGEQITMDRNSGEITVVGGAGNRVEAVFESEGEAPGKSPDNKESDTPPGNHDRTRTP